MMQPDLLVFATRYDDVTQRTYSIAIRLLADAHKDGISTVSLLETAAVERELVAAAARGPHVIALYSHGDLEGRVLTHDQTPCWDSERVPDLSGIAVFAHACRAICWLKSEATRHRARLLVGYECDLKTPANGSERFWEIYAETHSFVPRHLARRACRDWIRDQFYHLCTTRFHELNKQNADLMELIAIEQSRDEIVFA